MIIQMLIEIPHHCVEDLVWGVLYTVLVLLIGILMLSLVLDTQYITAVVIPVVPSHSAQIPPYITIPPLLPL